MNVENGKIYRYNRLRDRWDYIQGKKIHGMFLVLILDKEYTKDGYLILDLDSGARRTISSETWTKREPKQMNENILNNFQRARYEKGLKQVKNTKPVNGNTFLNVEVKNKIEIMDAVDLKPGECMEIDGQFYVAVRNLNEEETELLCLNTWTLGNVNDVGVRRRLHITVSE